jgi:hypothetical protein
MRQSSPIIGRLGGHIGSRIAGAGTGIIMLGIAGIGIIILGTATTTGAIMPSAGTTGSDESKSLVVIPLAALCCRQRAVVRRKINEPAAHFCRGELRGGSYITCHPGVLGSVGGAQGVLLGVLKCLCLLQI